MTIENIENVPVDIAFTSYNTSKYVENCLNSILKQEHKNWNLIMIDDCSSDNTVEIIRKFVKYHNLQDKCKLYQLEKNYGYGTTLKYSIEYGKNEIICIVDSDDALARTDSLSIMVENHLKNPDVSLIYSNYYSCDETLGLKSNRIRRRLIQTRNPKNGESYFGKFLGKTYQKGDLRISHLKAFKRSYYDLTEGLDNTLVKAVDQDLILKLEEVGKLFHIPIPLYLHRKHSKSISGSYKDKSFIEKQKISESKLRMYTNAYRRRNGHENINR